MAASLTPDPDVEGILLDAALMLLDAVLHHQDLTFSLLELFLECLEGLLQLPALRFALTTFGAPRPGNDAFARLVQSYHELGQRWPVVRFVADGDVVPAFPKTVLPWKDGFSSEFGHEIEVPCESWRPSKCHSMIDTYFPAADLGTGVCGQRGRCHEHDLWRDLFYCRLHGGCGVPPGDRR